jgi:hypothetical protein
MAVFQVVNIDDAKYERQEAARVAGLLTGGRGVMTEDEATAQAFGKGIKGDTRLTPWQRERFAVIVAETAATVERRKFNPDTDTMLTADKALRLVPESIGRTLSVKIEYHYMGDGDGYYYGTATLVNDDGTTRKIQAGGARYYNGRAMDTRDGADLHGSTVDVADELVTIKLAYDTEQARLAEIRQRTADIRQLQTGRLVRVVKGRKLAIGTTGRVAWVGEDQYSRYGGLRVGIKVDGEAGLQYTAATNIDVIAEPYGDDLNGE